MSTVKKIGLSLREAVQHNGIEFKLKLDEPVKLGDLSYTVSKGNKGSARYVLTIRTCHEEPKQPQS